MNGTAPADSRVTGLVAPLTGVLVALVATVVITQGTRGRGIVLFRDDVQVPHPVWGDAVLGAEPTPPRAVPFAGVLTALSHLVGAGGAQRLLLLAPLLLAGCGVAMLLRRHGALAAGTAALVAVWNPYVAERLGLGQAPTLLAYGALPWLVLVARSATACTWRRAAYSTLAFVPAAVTPVGSVLGLVVLVASAVAWRRRWRAGVASVVGPVLLCAPWVAAALTAGVTTGTSDGAAAFAARDDTGGGLLLSVATLGGVWSPAAAPGSRHDPLAAAAGVALLLLGATGVRRLGPRAVWLAASWAVPVVAVTVAATRPGVALVRAVQGVPGAGLLRDTHRLLAPSAVALAIGVGLGASALARRALRWGARRVLVSTGLALGAAALVVSTGADLPASVTRDYAPRRVPADWQDAVRTVDRSGLGVLSMPWQPLRRTSWSGQQVFLDPLDRGVHGHVVRSTRLVVSRGGRLLVTDADPPTADAARWLRGEVVAADLARLGVGWVLEYRGTPGAPVVAAPGVSVVMEGPHVRLWRVDEPVGRLVDPAQRRLLLAAWGLAAGVAAAAVVGALVGAATRLRNGRAQPVPQNPTSR